MPLMVTSAQHVPGKFIPKGTVIELKPGQFLIEGEANHPVKTRGWFYTLSTVDSDDKLIEETANPELIKEMRNNGLKGELLLGHGEIANCIRAIHASRLGFLTWE